MAGIPWAESYLGRVRAAVGDDSPLMFVGARGVVLDDAGRLLLIKRADNGRWALPAGAMELGESITDCAVREVYEETGLRPTALTPFALYTGPRYTYTNVYAHTYQLFLTAFWVHTWTGTLATETDETTDAGFFALDELPAPASPILTETLADLADFERTRVMVLK